MRGLVVTLVLVLIAAPALGQPSLLPTPPPARIVMRLDFSGVRGCADPEQFILTLTPRVHGWDPLAVDGRWRLVLTVEREAPGFKGSAELHDPSGEVFRKRAVPPKASCFILLDRLSYLTAFRIDPPGAPPPALPPPPEPAKPPAPPPEPPEPRPEPPQPPKQLPVVAPAPPDERAPPRLVPRLGAGARADFGPAAGALFGVTIEGGVQRRQWEWGGWSLMGTFRWAPQQVGIGPPTTDPAVDVSTSLVAGGLTGCVHRAWRVSLAGCVVDDLGEVQQSAGTPTFPNLHQTVLFAGAGVSARIEVPLSDVLYAQMAADVRGVAKLAGSTNQSTNVAGRNFGGAAGGLGAGLGISF